MADRIEPHNLEGAEQKFSPESERLESGLTPDFKHAKDSKPDARPEGETDKVNPEAGQKSEPNIVEQIASIKGGPKDRINFILDVVKKDKRFDADQDAEEWMDKVA